MYSTNNRLVVEPYKKDGLKSSVNNGFAMIQQKVSVKGLKVLMDATLNDGTRIKKGSIAYVKEEELHSKPWAQKTMESDALPGQQFLILEFAYVEFIVPYAGGEVRPGAAESRDEN